MAAASTDLQVFLAQHKQLIEAFLAQLLPPQTAEHQLCAALRYSALNNGKRLRPALVYATGQMLGVPIAKLHAAAAAVELIHCYSLIHDDLPAMDNDDLRRGLPTCHKAYDEATAILAGDALQSLAFEVLADASLNPLSAALRIAMITVLAKAVGPAGMILGQAEDMAAENKTLDLAQLIQLHNHKTGALFSACIELSLIASDQYDNPAIRESLGAYAQHIGLAFQIQDDILDVISNNETLGKPVGSDQAAGKSTFPSLLGLEGAQQYAMDTINQAFNALKPFGSAAQLLKDLANHILNRAN